MARRVQKKEEVITSSPGARPEESDGSQAEETRMLAHQFWLERGSPIGTPEDDWFRAEEEIRRRRQ